MLVEEATSGLKAALKTGGLAYKPEITWRNSAYYGSSGRQR